MTKRLLFLFLLCAAPMIAQTTAVTATITDSDSQVWANGTYSVTFVPNPNYSGQYQYQGSVFVPQIYSGSMNGSGAFSVTLPDVNFISPAGTSWKFNLCSRTSAPCSQRTYAVTGASLNLTSYFSSGGQGAVTAPRFPATGTGAYGYADAEVNQIPVPGGQYYNVTVPCPRVWNGSSFSCSGSGAQPDAPNENVIYVSPNCGTQSNCYTIHDDGQLILDATYTNGSPTVTSGSSDPCFVAADVGKIVFATNLPQTGYSGFIGSGLTINQTTIKTVNSCHSITLSANAGSGSTANTPFFWGSDDTTVLNTAGLAAAATCSTLMLPGGNAQGTGAAMMLISSQMFGVGNYNCLASVGAWRTGFGIVGQGPHASIFVIAPNFSAASCAVGGISLNWCFGPTYYGDTEAGGFYNQGYSLTGFGDQSPTNSFASVSAFMVVGSNSTTRDVFLTGFGGTQSGFIGFRTVGNAVASIDNAQVDGFGNQAAEFDGITIMRGGSFFGDVPGIDLGINGYTLSFGDQMGCNSGGPIVEVFSSGNWYSHIDAAQTNGCAGSGSTGVYVHGGHAYFSTSNLAVTTAGSIALKIDNSGTVQADQTTFAASGSGSQAFNIASGSTFNDGGNNTVSSAASNTISGTYNGFPLKGTCSMSSATTCTISLTSLSSAPVCIAVEQGSASEIAASCAYSAGTVTVTAASSNSQTWGVVLY